MNNKISVILPIYNVAPYLEKCLNSIVNNTYKNMEIICVNDGSSDNSLEICRKFAGAHDTNFIIIDQKNAGVSAARNAGLRVATGDYIMFIDPDDYIHPRCFQILHDGLQANNADIALCPYEKVYDGHEIPTISDDFDVLSTFYSIEFQGYNMPHVLRTYVCGRIYKKCLLDKMSFNENMAAYEDGLFSISIYANNPKLKVVTTSIPLYYYYQRPHSAKNHPIEWKITAYNEIMKEAEKYSGDRERNFFAFTALRTISAAYLCKNSECISKENIKRIKKMMRKAYALFGKLPIKYKILFGTTAFFPQLYYAKVQLKTLLKKTK